MKINRAKQQLVKTAQRKLGLEQEDYKALLEAEGGVSSSTDLDDRGFENVMARFRLMGWVGTYNAKPSSRARASSTPGDVPTKNQLWRIDQNFERMGFDTKERRAGFIARQLGELPWGRIQTVQQARDLITAQEVMLRRMSVGCTHVSYSRACGAPAPFRCSYMPAGEDEACGAALCESHCVTISERRHRCTHHPMPVSAEATR